MPSSAVVRRAVLSELRRIPLPGLIVEAGSGWGTLALQLATYNKAWRIVGIENSWIPLWVSKLSASLKRTAADLDFQHGDIYQYQYDQADVVICYLYPGAMTRLSTIMRVQLKPGAYLISVCFAMPGWEPERVVTCGDLYRTKLYIYRVKE
ncbi:class I SAM-dependent methyltransferase [Paenibacillus sp. JCM 10914]|uniref:class I SAM-dependent methyltransferase n=1 Tax=Paenibacillus sp. JCM 10914 TaxID=1236974 RepID=UPI001E2EFCCD|nr:class I SAM-dependent methyltransferase [Paenibacillus sp. JCM 10914]